MLDKRTVGYVGGSITELPVVGYHEVTDARLMWKRLDYGGGTIGAWLDDGAYFARFDAEAAKHPPEVCWWMLCARDTDLGTDAALWADVLSLYAAIDSRLPTGCRLYVSTMAAYAPDTDPQLQQAPKRLAPMTARLVTDGHALTGPAFPPLTKATIKPGRTGHQNKTRRRDDGRILDAFWSAL